MIMKFANDMDIQRWRNDTAGRGDNLESAVLILDGIAADANAHSDGWHSWPKPCRAARKLIELIERSTDIRYALQPVHARELRAALAPVRAFYTREHAKRAEWPSIPPHCEGRT